MHGTHGENKQKEKISKLNYYLLCGFIIALGLLFIFQGFAAIIR